MKTYKKIIWSALMIALTAISCNDPYNDKPSDTATGPVQGPVAQTALDTWLYESFTQPFNIEVKYRVDASEVDLYKVLTPPEPTQVEDVMDVVRKVWIDPYISLAGDAFIKQYCPKQFVLVGSARYNFDGSITLGTAEGGRKVVLYVVNDFTKNSRPEVKEMIHTIQHEFVHILNQKVPYPAELKQITPGGYTAAWTSISLADARAQGFITNYAMVSPDEDIAEMVSMMLVEGKQGYEDILSCQTTPESYAAIRRKEQIVVDYYKKAFGIDLYALQTAVQEAMQKIAPVDNGGTTAPPPLLNVWGYGKEYSTLHIDLMTLPESANVTARYSADNEIMRRRNFAVDMNYKVTFTDANQLTLTLYYYNIFSEVREYREANFVYRVSGPYEDGTIDIALSVMDANAEYMVNTLGARNIVSYLGGTFIPDWALSCTGQWYPALYPYEAPDNYLIGILGN